MAMARLKLVTEALLIIAVAACAIVLLPFWLVYWGTRSGRS